MDALRRAWEEHGALLAVGGLGAVVTVVSVGIWLWGRWNDDPPAPSPPRYSSRLLMTPLPTTPQREVTIAVINMEPD